MRQYPSWLKKRFSTDGTVRSLSALVADLALETVCQSARCPNLSECWSQKQLTFMILGDRCTRSCGFCAVGHGRPQRVAKDEPERVAEAVKRLALRHAVITSVARDELEDEGAGHFVQVIKAVRGRNAATSIEVLVPDFHEREALVRKVVCVGRPEVFAHNVETVERLSKVVRPQASYRRSLNVLRIASALNTNCLVKSSVMVGLGEHADELKRTFEDLVRSGVTHLTIGQYLRPDAGHLPVLEYVSPGQFVSYEKMAREAGMRWVRSGPFVRSSYHAVDAVDEARDRFLAE